jgi:NitT/TauT family transport system substrate-binding protein
MTLIRKVNRRSVLAASAAASFATIIPRQAAAARYSIKASYITFASVVTYFAARERQFFEAEDISITDAAVANNLIVPTVLSGQYDMSVTNIVDTANVVAKGGDLRVIYPAGVLGTAYPYAQVVVPSDSQIKGPKDLAGKKIAVAATRSSIDAGVKYWLKLNGVDLSTVSIVAVGQTGVIPAMRSKQFDAALAIEPAIAIMEAEGVARPIGYAGDVGSLNLVAVYVARESWVDKNMDAAKAYVRALDKANEWLLANPDAGPDLITKYCGIQPDVAKRMIKAGLTRVARKADIQDYFKVLTDYEVLEKGVDPCTLLSKVCPKEGC